MSNRILMPIEKIEKAIYLVRGERVTLDRDQSLRRSDMFIDDEWVRRRRSVRSAMSGTVYISLLAERRQDPAVDVYKHLTPTE